MTDQDEKDPAGLHQRLKTLAAEAIFSPPHPSDLSKTEAEGRGRRRRARTFQAVIAGIAVIAIALPIAFMVQDRPEAGVALGDGVSPSETGRQIPVATDNNTPDAIITSVPQATDDRPPADGPAEAMVMLTDGRTASAQLTAAAEQGAGPLGLVGQVLVTDVPMGVASVAASRWDGAAWQAVNAPAQGLVLERAEPDQPFDVRALRADDAGTFRAFEPGWHQLEVVLWPQGDREREVVLHEVVGVADSLEAADPRLLPFVRALLDAAPGIRSRLYIEPSGLVAEVRPGRREDGGFDTGFRTALDLPSLDIPTSALLEDFGLGDGQATSVLGFGTYVFGCGDAIVAVNPAPADGQDRDAGTRLAIAVGCTPQSVSG